MALVRLVSILAAGWCVMGYEGHKLKMMTMMIYVMFIAALHRCGREGDVQACRVLLQYGIDPTIISLQGYTASQVSSDAVQRLLHGEGCVIFILVFLFAYSILARFNWYQVLKML